MRKNQAIMFIFKDIQISTTKALIYNINTALLIIIKIIFYQKALHRGSASHKN